MRMHDIDNETWMAFAVHVFLYLKRGDNITLIETENNLKNLMEVQDH